jgi:hypothetical protein
MNSKTIDAIIEDHEQENQIEKTKHYCVDEWGQQIVFETSPLLDELLSRLKEIIKKSNEIQASVDSKAISLIKRSVDYSKTSDQRLIIIEEKLALIYEMMVRED